MAQVTRELMKSLRADLDSALSEVAKKHGILIRVGSGTYAPDGATGHYKLELAAGGGSPDEKVHHVTARADWKRCAELFGLAPDWCGKTFSRNGTPCTIIGLMPKRQKYPVLVSYNGKEVLLTVDEVTVRMKKAAAGAA